VARSCDVVDRLLVRRFRDAQLDHTDRLAATGDRREEPSPASFLDHLDGLGAQRPPVRRPGQGDPVCGLRPGAPRGRCRGGVSEPDQRVAAEVGDEEADVLGTRHVLQRLGDHVDRVDRRGGLCGGKQRADVETGSAPSLHAAVASAHALDVPRPPLSHTADGVRRRSR
jgi:hypothetical protein